MKIFDISNKRRRSTSSRSRPYCGSHTHTLVPSKNGKTVYLYVSSYSPNGQLPGLPAAARLDLDHRGPGEEADLGEGRRHPEPLPGRWLPQRGPAAATTSPPTRPRTSPPAPAWVTASCSTSPTGPTRSSSTRSRTPRTSPSGTRRPSTTPAPRSSSPTSSVAAAPPPATRPSARTGAPTPSTTWRPRRSTTRARARARTSGKGKEKTYELSFASYYKIPRTNANTENCVAHNGSLIPVKGKDIMVQAWYQGGISVWDFTDSANPVEIAYWERGPLSDERADPAAAPGRRTGTTATSTPATSRRAWTCWS